MAPVILIAAVAIRCARDHEAALRGAVEPILKSVPVKCGVGLIAVIADVADVADVVLARGKRHIGCGRERRKAPLVAHVGAEAAQHVRRVLADLERLVAPRAL